MESRRLEKAHIGGASEEHVARLKVIVVLVPA